MLIKYTSQEAKKLCKLAGPILLGSLATTGMAFTDTVMAGRVSSLDLAGLSLATAIYILIVFPLSAIMMAVTPVIAKDHGENDYNKIHHHFFQLLYTTVGITVIAMLILCGSAFLFGYMDLEPRVEKVAHYYLLIVTLGIPFAYAFNTYRALTDGLSNTVITMICCMAGLAFNVVLNYIFIYGKCGAPALGGIGCAVATTIVQIIMLLAQIILIRRIPLIKKVNIFSAIPKIDLSIIKDYFKLSFPLGIAIFFEIGIFSLFAFVATYMGSAAMAANQIFFNYMSIVYMLPMALSHAASIRVGFTQGTRDIKGTKNVITTSLTIGLLMALVVGGTSYFLREPIIGIYTTDAEVAAMLVDSFLCVSIYQLGDYCQIISVGVLRGLQRPKIITVMAIITYWLIATPVALLLAFTNFMWGPHGFVGMWIALCISLYILAIAYMWRINHYFAKSEYQTIEAEDSEHQKI